MSYFALHQAKLKVMKKTEKATSTMKRKSIHRRLLPLRQFMLNEEYSVAMLATEMGKSRSTVSRWFKEDDVRISTLYEAARAMGGQVEWRIVKD